MSSTQKGILLSLAGFSLFSIGDAVFKYLSPYYTVYTIGFFASVFALFTLMVAAMCSVGLKQAFQTDHKKLHLLRGVSLSMQFLCVIYALNNLSMANTYALVFIAPFLTIILSVLLLKEKISGRKFLIVAVGFSGVLLVLRPGFIPMDMASLAAIGAALFFSISNITARFIGDHDGSPLAFGIYVELVIIPITATLVLMSGFVMPAMPHLGLLVIAGLCGGIGMVCVARGFVLVPAVVAAPFQYVQMLWAIGFGYLIFGDVLDIWIAAGAVIIIASGILIVRSKA